jgi:hypothetical protein
MLKHLGGKTRAINGERKGTEEEIKSLLIFTRP